MNILAVDTSGTNCGVAIVHEQEVIGAYATHTGKTHSETLLPAIDEFLHQARLSLEDMDAYACCIGPGSFTGIRIGISTIKGFAVSVPKPVIPISSLELLAHNAPSFEGLIGSMLDARNRNVYAALYQGTEPFKMVGDYYTDTVEEWINALKTMPQKIMFVGDGAKTYQTFLQEELKDKAFFVPEHLNEPSTISLARVALTKWENKEVDTAENLHPLYLRKSQAERLSEQS